MMFRSASLLGVLVLCLAVSSGCGCGGRGKVELDPNNKDLTRDVPLLIKRLEAKDGAEKMSAMVWLRRLGAEAQPAIPKLTDIAAKDKNPNVKKFAQDTIGIIQGK